MKINKVDLLEALKIVSKKGDISHEKSGVLTTINGFDVIKTNHISDKRDSSARSVGITKEKLIDVLQKFFKKEPHPKNAYWHIIFKNENNNYDDLLVAVENNKITIVSIIQKNQDPELYFSKKGDERALIEKFLLNEEFIIINEIIYKPDLKLNSLKDKIKELGNLIYSGNKYNLYDNKIFFIITDKDKNILFYQKYTYYNLKFPKNIKFYKLEARENVSTTPKLFNLFQKLIYSLLFLGYPLKDDHQHNIFSYNSIKKLLYTGKVRMYYQIDSGELNEIDSEEELKNVFNIKDINLSILYTNKDISQNDLLESIYHQQWQEQDLFDEVDDYM